MRLRNKKPLNSVYIGDINNQINVRDRQIYIGDGIIIIYK